MNSLCMISDIKNARAKMTGNREVIPKTGKK